jgi:LCP family protein required for cell wall assembly
MPPKPKFTQLQKTLTKLRRQLLSHPKIIRAVIIVAVLLTLIFTASKTLPSLTILETPSQHLFAFLNPDQHLRHTHHRTNFILLGIGGAAHEAGDLTDTIIFVSIDLETKDTLLLPLPRDLWVSSLRAKLNTAYHYGEEQKPGTGGLILTKAAVGEILDQPIHYAALINFDGLKNLVDLAGGIDINIPHTFDDYYYPIPGMEEAEPEELRYEHLHFDAGLQHLDGTTALKFVRSRHSQDPEEGTDFARQRRQQLVILALKDRLLTPKFLLKSSNIKALKSLSDRYLITDFPNSSAGALLHLALQFNTQNLRTAQIPASTPESPNSQALLINPSISKEYDNQWVLVPQDQDWTQVHTFIECLLYQPIKSDCNQIKKDNPSLNEPN